MKKLDSRSTTIRRRSPLLGATGLFAAAASLFAINAHACILAPGTSCALSGTTESAEPYLAGTVLQDDLVPFSISLSDGGIYEHVEREEPRISLMKSKTWNSSIKEKPS